MKDLVLKMQETPKNPIRFVVLVSILLLSIIALISIANPWVSPTPVAAASPHLNPAQALNALCKHLHESQRFGKHAGQLDQFNQHYD